MTLFWRDAGNGFPHPYALVHTGYTFVARDGYTSKTLIIYKTKVSGYFVYIYNNGPTPMKNGNYCNTWTNRMTEEQLNAFLAHIIEPLIPKGLGFASVKEELE